MTHFDGVATLNCKNNEICNGTPFYFGREFRVLVPTTTGNDRVLSPGTDVVLEVVRVAANERFPALMPAMYPGLMATDPLPQASLDAISRSLSD